MKLLPHLAGLAVLPLLLAGCATTSTPTPTVTVTVSPPTPTLDAAEAAPWDLHAVCAVEAAISTLEQWRDDQKDAGRLTAGQSSAVDQAIAVQYLEMHQFIAPSSVQEQVDALEDASGTLERPRIDLESTAVRTARTSLAGTCVSNRLTIGVIAQGG